MQTEPSRGAIHTRKMDADTDAISGTNKLDYSKAELGSRDLRRALEAAIQRQAKAWGVRVDQAQALLLDRKAVA